MFRAHSRMLSIHVHVVELDSLAEIIDGNEITKIVCYRSRIPEKSFAFHVLRMRKVSEKEKND